MREPDVVLPVQFHDIWSATPHRSAEFTLAVAVLERTIDDMERYRGASAATPRLLYREARRWVASTDRRWPYSFVNVCGMLNLSCSRLRARLLADGPAICFDTRAADGGDTVAAVRRESARR